MLINQTKKYWWIKLRHIKHNKKKKKKKRRELVTGSAKRLNKKGCTSSRVSGPPRLSNKTPVLSSPTIGVLETSGWASEVTSAPNGNKCLLIDCLENKDCVSDHPQENLASMWFFERLWQASIWTPEQRYNLWDEHIACGNSLSKQRTPKYNKFWILLYKLVTINLE